MLLLKLAIFLPLIALFGLLIRADFTQRRLPNLWVGYYALLFPLYAWTQGFSSGQFVSHCLMGAGAFLVMLLPFIRGGIGGGDIKLATVVMMWAGPYSAAPTVLIIGVCGALLGISGWLVDKMVKHPLASDAGSPGFTPGYWISARRGVPYGAALVAGGITVLISQGVTY